MSQQLDTYITESRDRSIVKNHSQLRYNKNQNFSKLGELKIFSLEGFWDNRVYSGMNLAEGTVVNGCFNIIRTSKC